MRPLGYQRFTIWTLHRLINLRTYRGKISYLPKEDDKKDDTENKDIKNPNSTSGGIFPVISEFKKDEISNISDSEFEDIISLETIANLSLRSRCNSLLSTESRKSTYYSIAESIYHSISEISECNETNKNKQNDEYHLRRISESKAFPSLKETLPETWIVEDGEFVMIHAVYQSHIGSDCYFSPESQLNDGTIYLVIIRGGISRYQLFNFLINMSSGSHLPTKNTDFIKVERVVAFRLEPYENNSILTVDGERIECGSLQAKILPGSINVMVPQKAAFTEL